MTFKILTFLWLCTAVLAASVQDGKRPKRSLPLLIQCQGVGCLFQVLSFTTYR